jgi:hypothetical protein
MSNVPTTVIESPLRQLTRQARDLRPTGLDIVHALAEAINTLDSALIQARNLVDLRESPERVNSFIEAERAKVVFALQDWILDAAVARS